MELISAIVIAEVICLVCAFLLLKGDRVAFWKLNILYLLIALLSETFGNYLFSLKKNNLWLYNIFILFEISFIFTGLYHGFKKYINPKPVIFSGLGFIYLIYLFFFFKAGIMEFNSVTVTVMSVVFTFYGLYYYYLLLKDENFVEINGHPEFWWVTGVVFYYFGSTVINLLYHVFDFKLFKGFTLSYLIIIILNIILYSIWTYSYLCRARQRKSQY
ncbi:hypothetical protein [Pedobacter sandarakinus]|uniref:hypothetical protein n=1 Tax=Pedobacter sandarakinus TaxID=353156 RepID=UPI002247F2F2|nr:hypothetical protein [Pedobacter sandarakinus]MCX2573410.1 hypothetical protein [Pedobacter sandarakinus]